MEFLKAILGDELYAQFETAVNAYNGNEANKDKQVKVGNLGGGEYVGKGKYDALQTLLDGKTSELETANTLIADLKKSTKGNEDLQGKITDYEGQIAQLQAENQQLRVDSEINIGLLAAGVDPDDIDYVTFKLKAKGEITLDENGKIKGWDDKLAGLKTQLPTFFESSGDGDDNYQVFEPNKLKRGDGGDTAPTKERFQTMSYEERVALKQKNENLYKQLAK